MSNILILHGWLLLFAGVVFLCARVQITTPTIATYLRKSVNPRHLLLRVGVTSVIVYLLLLSGLTTAIKLYVTGTFVLLYLGGAAWMSTLFERLMRHVWLISTIFFCCIRILYPANMGMSNIFLILAIAWVGPVLVYSRILGPKRLLFFSLIWLVYDIFFVWFTPAAIHLTRTFRTIDFPLWIGWGRSGIGSGDLLYLSFLVASQKTTGRKFLVTGSLVLSSFLLSWYAYTYGGIKMFPLLVLWVPIGAIIQLSDPHLRQAIREDVQILFARI